MKKIGLAGVAIVALGAVAGTAIGDGKTDGGMPAAEGGERAVAIFAGGCFWCMEGPFDAVDGVISTTSGYTGGHKAMPTYEEVSSGSTGHAESVKVVYDPTKVRYEKLLDVYWHNIDPVTANAQFCDHGTQYRSAIFYGNEAQKEAALKSRDAIAASSVLPGPIVTQIVPASDFYAAEAHHQNFYKTNPIKYKFYRFTCGRDQRLDELWGDAAGGGSHG